MVKGVWRPGDASYNGSNLDVLRQNQLLASDFGPTQFDERNRLNGSGVFQLPWGFQVNPIFTWSSARPYSAYAGLDLKWRWAIGCWTGPALDSVRLPTDVNLCRRTASAAKALIQLDLRTAKDFHFGERIETTIACGDVQLVQPPKQLQLCGQHFLQFRWHTES